MSNFLTLTGLSHFLDKIKGIFVHAATDTTEGHIVTFGADGKTVTDGGFTVKANVPANAKFTDTTYTAATASKAGLMAAADKTKLDSIDPSTYATKTSLDDYAKKSDIASVYIYKGSVANYAALPSDAETGWVYNIEAADDTHSIKAGDNVAWNGTAWDNLSGIFEVDMQEITNAEIDTLFAA